MLNAIYPKKYCFIRYCVTYIEFSITIIKSSTLRNKNIDVAYRARPFPYGVPICHLNWTPVRARCKHADSHH